MTRWPPCPYKVKTIKIVCFGTDWPMLLQLDIQHQALIYHKVCSNDDISLNFDLFTQTSTIVPYTFVWEKAYMVDYLETI